MLHVTSCKANISTCRVHFRCSIKSFLQLYFSASKKCANISTCRVHFGFSINILLNYILLLRKCANSSTCMVRLFYQFFYLKKILFLPKCANICTCRVHFGCSISIFELHSFASNFSELASGRSHSVGALLKKKKKRKKKARSGRTWYFFPHIPALFMTSMIQTAWYKMAACPVVFSRHYSIDFEQTGPEIELKAVGRLVFVCLFDFWCVCVCVRACVRASVRACARARACVRACVCVCVLKKDYYFLSHSYR